MHRTAATTCSGTPPVACVSLQFTDRLLQVSPTGGGVDHRGLKPLMPQEGASLSPVLTYDASTCTAPGTSLASTLERGEDMSDEHERHQELHPEPATRGFESMDSAANDQAREVLREEGLAPQGSEAAPPDRLIHDLTHPDPPPLTQAERAAAEHDPGRPERVYAPASARVPKEPAPGDDRLIHG